MNRLTNETSPYLRQHADNPVDWFPWGEEAFERARIEDKPVLLSIGYSACHWCHVMAHESFEDPATAALMNELVISVKVDREERPDIDAIYMDAVQAMSGRGGWPMTVFLMPDGKPFFGGTYFPREPRGNMISFSDLLRRIDDVWRNRRSDLDEQASEMVDAMSRGAQFTARDVVPGDEALTHASNALAASFDHEWGGFGSAPKFPQTMSLEFLLRTYVTTQSAEILDMVTTSLDAMASGGMYDQIGGGFARYSVDRQWLVPHFEKMLYDQALLAKVYLHAWQVTGADRYLQILTETINYVNHEMRHEKGGYFSAEDADSLTSDGHAEEGAFYTWQLEELQAVLGTQAQRAADWWGVTADGNFEGRTILNRPVRGDLIRPEDIEHARRALFEHRAKRPRPGLDDKVLTEWNALMIATVAEAALATENGDWLALAIETGEFLLANLRREDGRWLRSWQQGLGPRAQDDRATDSDGRAQHLAYAGDYGALIDAFTRLGEASGQARWINTAQELAEQLIDLFWDDENGGVFTTGRDAQRLVTRPKDLMDNATPSANSLAAVGLLRLGALTGNERFADHSAAILRLLAEPATTHPSAFGHLLAAVDLWNRGTIEIAIVGVRPDLLRIVADRFRPNTVLAWGEPYDSPLWNQRDNGPTNQGQAYVCRNFACERPSSTPVELMQQLA
ncbi:MAG: thioredoxin domain-containing protein [Actinomycetes bacterium]